MMNQSLSQQQGHVNSELIVLRAISQQLRREPRPNKNHSQMVQHQQELASQN